jgi:hypothetical protein
MYCKESLMRVERISFAMIMCAIIAVFFFGCVSSRIEPITTTPQGLFATQQLTDEIMITWDAVQGSSDTYLIESTVSLDGEWLPLALVQGEYTYTLREVDGEQDRFFRVALADSKGERVSEWSAPVIGRQSKESNVTKVLLPASIADGSAIVAIAVDGDTIWVVFTEVVGEGPRGGAAIKLLMSHNQGESWSQAVTLDAVPEVTDLVLQSYGGLAHLVYTVPALESAPNGEMLRYVRISKEGMVSASSDILTVPTVFDGLDMAVGYDYSNNAFSVMVLFIEAYADSTGGRVGYVFSNTSDLEWTPKVVMLETRETYDRSRSSCSLSMQEDGSIVFALDMGALSGLYGAGLQFSTGRLTSEAVQIPLETLCCDIEYQNFTSPRLQHDGQRLWIAVNDIGYEAVNVYTFWLEDGVPAGEVHVSLAVGTWTTGSYEVPRIVLFGETPFIGYTHAQNPVQDGRRAVVAFPYGEIWYPFFINTLPVGSAVSLDTNGKYVFAVFSENLDMAEGSSAQLVFARSDTSGTAWTRL